MDANDYGAVTTEYALVTIAAAGLAGVLAWVLRSDEVRARLLDAVLGSLSG